MAEKVAWLLQIAGLLDVPVIAMAEDINRAGNLTQAIQDVLPKEISIFSKDSFGLADNPDILAAVKATGRKTAILVGMETDVCVAQSALGMREAGAVISSVKALYYEWLRSVSNCDALREKKRM